jgi:hypothetical protein
MGRWEGRFSTMKYPPSFGKGNITVDDIDLNKSGYTTNATIVYTGFFRKGRTVTVKLRIEGDTMTIDVGEGRKVTFTANQKTDKIISGKYVCINPNDHGQFYIQPEGSPVTPDPNNCSIM